MLQVGLDRRYLDCSSGIGRPCRAKDRQVSLEAKVNSQFQLHIRNAVSNQKLIPTYGNSMNREE